MDFGTAKAPQIVELANDPPVSLVERGSARTTSNLDYVNI